MFAAAKYTKTASATSPLACAANHYRFNANAIQYDSSTGAMSNDVCTSCGDCPSPYKTACGDTSPPVCCTTKPPLSAYSASTGAIDSTCAFTCTDPNAEVGPVNSCQCKTGWERGSDSSLCTETPRDHVWTVYSEKACAGRNELGARSGITIVDAQALCQDHAACVSFERMTTAGNFQFSTSCDPSTYVDSNNFDLYVIARRWTVYSEKACAGRNELPSQSGITIVDAQAWCQDNAACVSFERMPTAGSFQFSTSCTPSTYATYSNFDLYVIARRWTVYSEKACAGRNELGAQSGITIVDAQALCQDNAACVSFERMPTAGNFQFSTSCDPSTYATYSNHELYVIDRVIPLIW
jgi:hypothetical protein